MFLLSNRHPAPVSFWPFGPIGSAATGAVVLIAFAIGVLAGMLIHLPHRLRASRRARRAEQQVAALQARVQQPPSPPLSLSS
ncbi:MAG TPA: lipopolysaccharide assembly protein LapA domain-containing protein [Acidiphilium sp.]